MPITQAVVALLEGRLTPAEAVARLMAREAREESPLPDEGPAQAPPA
jgi:glycerol-3-phosphate dehydrogenase (NAD(P)+)